MTQSPCMWHTDVFFLFASFVEPEVAHTESPMLIIKRNTIFNKCTWIKYILIAPSRQGEKRNSKLSWGVQHCSNGLLLLVIILNCKEICIAGTNICKSTWIWTRDSNYPGWQSHQTEYSKYSWKKKKKKLFWPKTRPPSPRFFWRAQQEEHQFWGCGALWRPPAVRRFTPIFCAALNLHTEEFSGKSTLKSQSWWTDSLVQQTAGAGEVQLHKAKYKISR